MEAEQEKLNPIYWFQTAERLMISASAMKEKLFEIKSRNREKIIYTVGVEDHQKQKLAYFQSYMMLMAFAVENQLKGFALERHLENNPSTPPKNFAELKNDVWKVKGGHELKQIASNCGIALNPEEEDLLERHEEFLKWAGRYPVPIKMGDYYTAMDNNTLQYKSTDDYTLECLFSKLTNSL